MTLFLLFTFLPYASAITLDIEYQHYTLQSSELGQKLNFEVDFFFDKTGVPQGGIILTYNEAMTHQAKNLGYVLSQHGWSVVTAQLSTEPTTPARTRNPIQPIKFTQDIDTANKPDTTETDQASEPNGSTESDAPQTEPASSEPSAKLTANSAESKINPPKQLTEPPAPGLTPRAKPVNQLAAIIDFMEQQKGQLNLVFLSFNQSWIAVCELIQQRPFRLNNVYGMVLVDAKDSQSMTDMPAAMPILDINILPSAAFAFKNRKTAARRLKFLNYQQVNLQSFQRTTDFEEDILVKRIRGWLKINVKGMEVEKR
ncbi:MAG: alpha/beta hydrolase family protein [Pseudomonadales bacterium]|nr:alpha/beta hydrolase family protein [Pseudomonadales bacterium]